LGGSPRLSGEQLWLSAMRAIAWHRSGPTGKTVAGPIRAPPHSASRRGRTTEGRGSKGGIALCQDAERGSKAMSRGFRGASLFTSPPEGRCPGNPVLFCPSGAAANAVGCRAPRTSKSGEISKPVVRCPEPLPFPAGDPAAVSGCAFALRSRLELASPLIMGERRAGSLSLIDRDSLWRRSWGLGPGSLEVTWGGRASAWPPCLPSFAPQP
jgi:hypothetical protein